MANVYPRRLLHPPILGQNEVGDGIHAPSVDLPQQPGLSASQWPPRNNLNGGNDPGSVVTHTASFPGQAIGNQHIGPHPVAPEAPKPSESPVTFGSTTSGTVNSESFASDPTCHSTNDLVGTSASESNPTSLSDSASPQDEIKPSDGKGLSEQSQEKSISPSVVASRSASPGPDPRLSIRYLCNPLPDQQIPDQSNNTIYTAVVNHYYTSTLGYSVYFCDNDPRNEFDACLNDKSSQRSELRAVLRAMQRLAPLANGFDKSNWTIYTSHESTARRIDSLEDPVARGPGEGVEEDISAMTIGSRSTTNMDLLLQIKELRKWLRQHGLTSTVGHVSSSNDNARKAAQLAQQGAEGQLTDVQRQRNTHIHEEPSIPNEVKPDEYQRVYTDGSTVQRDGETVAGYGVYFGYFDRRNECATVLGKGTGPRASLAAILRALVVISRANNGHRKWEIASCRGQYLQSVFELSKQWQLAGWKRNAGKPIANLSIYREARRILDALSDQGIEVRGVYISQKHQDAGIQFAGLLARCSAGDNSIEIPIKVAQVFDVPRPPGEDEPSILFTEATYKQRELKGRWKVRFGADPLVEGPHLGGFRDPRDQDGVCGSIHQSRERCVMFVLLKGLRMIEQGIERNWTIYCNSTDAVTIINRYLGRKSSEKPPLYVESVIKHVQRLQKHGYRFEFRVSPHVDHKSELRFDFGDVSTF